MTNDYFDVLLKMLEGWALKCGERILSNGTKLICPTPHIATEAWLHGMFPPLEIEKIDELENQGGFKLPDDFREFLKRANGTFLFSYTISIWGVRANYSRTGDDAWQPFDLLDHNGKWERPEGSPDSIIYFGSNAHGNNWCFFEFHENSYRIGETSREKFLPIAYWPDFWKWLIENVNELSEAFPLIEG
jgi:hypothetical protein